MKTDFVGLFSVANRGVYKKSGVPVFDLIILTWSYPDFLLFDVNDSVLPTWFREDPVIFVLCGARGNVKQAKIFERSKKQRE